MKLNNKTYMLIFIFGILLVAPLLSAQTYKKATTLDLKVPFEVNGSAASSTATCNVTINYPNASSLKENVSMTNKNNGDFNISLTPTEVNDLGIYEWTAFCCEDTSCAAGYGSFEITQSGDEKINSGQGISLFISLIVMLIIGVFFFLIAGKFEWWLGKTIFYTLSATIFFIAILYSLVILTQNFGGFSAFTEGYATFYMIIRVILGLILTFAFVWVLFIMARAWKIKRGFIDRD